MDQGVEGRLPTQTLRAPASSDLPCTSSDVHLRGCNWVFVSVPLDRRRGRLRNHCGGHVRTSIYGAYYKALVL
jgi:hypothetical protein